MSIFIVHLIFVKLALMYFLIAVLCFKIKFTIYII
jgi:hypothetical protein